MANWHSFGTLISVSKCKSFPAQGIAYLPHWAA